jgi:P27 family predicted phage terminase small subunit
MRGRKPRNKTDGGVCHLTCPTFLTQIAKKEWRRVYTLLSDRNAITELDAAVVTGYAQSYARWRESEQAIDKYGVVCEETTTSRAGVTTTRLRKNPAVTVSKETQGTMLRFIAALGLSPADRTRITSEAEAPEDDISHLLTPPEIESEDAE